MTGAVVVASCQSCLEDNWMREGQRALASASPYLPLTLLRHPHPVSVLHPFHHCLTHIVPSSPNLICLTSPVLHPLCLTFILLHVHPFPLSSPLPCSIHTQSPLVFPHHPPTSTHRHPPFPFLHLPPTLCIILVEINSYFFNNNSILFTFHHFARRADRREFLKERNRL